jgi:hypothetical protein
VLKTISHKKSWEDISITSAIDTRSIEMLKERVRVVKIIRMSKRRKTKSFEGSLWNNELLDMDKSRRMRAERRWYSISKLQISKHKD